MYCLPSSFAIGLETIIARVLFTRAAERIPINKTVVTFTPARAVIRTIR